MARTRQPNAIPGAEYLAKRFAKYHGHHGGLGGWIYGKDGEPLYHGWLRYFIGFKPSVMAWSLKHSGLSLIKRNGQSYYPSALELANALKGKRIKE